MPTPEELEVYWIAKSEKLNVGDRIELKRDTRTYSLDEVYTSLQHRWEPVEIVAILPRASAGNLVFEVKREDGQVTTWVPITPWRRFSH